MAPTTMRQWIVEGKNDFDSLKFHEKAPVPQLGDKDVLVKSECKLPVSNCRYPTTYKPKR